MGTLNLFNIFRARLFNIKLFGDTRLGIYKEISVEDVKLFITDFHNFNLQDQACDWFSVSKFPDTSLKLE